MDQHSAMVPVFVGIDVAKDRLDVHLLPSGETFVARDHVGLEQLVARLDQATPPWSCSRRPVASRSPSPPR